MVALLTNDRQSVALVLGAILSGIRLVSVPLPPRSPDLDRYGRFLRAICSNAGVGSIVADPEVAVLLGSIGIDAGPLTAGAGGGEATDGFALHQFSSGSTAAPKDIALSGADLATNVVATLAAVAPRAGDTTVSWLPLSHDMGLVGMLLASTVATSDRWVGPGNIVLLRPEDFLRAPTIWTDAISHWRGTFTASPDFGYRLAARDPRSAGDRDLSSLRCAIVGGEVVRDETLTTFAAAHASAGLSELALCPAYGLAEVGLAVTMTPPDRRWEAVDVSRDALAGGRAIPAAPDGARQRLVASGDPLPGYEVRTGTIGGDVLPLEVRGPSVGRDGRTGASFGAADGWLTTGDVGCTGPGGLFVCGRDDDYVVVHGRNLYAPAVEQAVGSVPGVRAGRVAVVSEAGGRWLVAVEPDPGPAGRDPSTLRRAVLAAVVDEVSARPSEVAVLTPGALPMTSSGKLQRHELRRRWVGDLLDPA